MFITTQYYFPLDLARGEQLNKFTVVIISCLLPVSLTPLPRGVNIGRVEVVEAIWCINIHNHSDCIPAKNLCMD